MKKEISILGCGWLGLPMAKELINCDFSIKGSTTSLGKIRKLESEGIKSYLIDIDNIQKDIQFFLDSEILLINIPSKNIEGFKNLISHIEKSEIKKIVLISSTSVYANSNEVVTEKTAILPTNLAEIESLFRENSYFKTTILRFGGLFGYDRKPINFISKKSVIKDPEGFINFIHRDDCIQIIKEVINKNIWSETLNACSPSHPKRIDFYSNEASKHNITTPIFENTSSSEFKIVNSDKVQNLLSYKFKYDELMNIAN